MKKFSLTILGLLFFAAIVLVSFFLLRVVFYQPSTILTSTECSPPCWNGIQPGVSTFTQVSNSLMQIQGVDAQSVNTTTSLSGEKIDQIIWLFQPMERDVSGTVFFENETVIAISIMTINSLRVEEAFKLLGEPSLVWPETDPSAERTVELSLIYPQEGFLVEAQIAMKKETNSVEIARNTRVYRVIYFDPTKYEELLNTRILIRRPLLTRKNTPQPWHGFGLIPVETD
jgi:hypothetical protein